MSIISFPGMKKQLFMISNICPACATIKTAQSSKMVSVKSDDAKVASESEAVRHFALTIAERILNDYELNNTSPYVVDKIIMILIKESRSMPKEL